MLKNEQKLKKNFSQLQTFISFVACKKMKIFEYYTYMTYQNLNYNKIII